MPDAERNRHYRAVAGTLELFLGAYFLDFGAIAAIFFARGQNLHAVMLALAGALLGILLIFRSGRLLAWHRWVFRITIIVSIAVPIGWLLK